jgi:hypothetical protein
MDSNKRNIPSIPPVPSFVSPIQTETMKELYRSIDNQAHRKNEAIDSTNFLADVQRSNLASEFARHLLSQIRRFDSELDPDHEVGMKLVSFGQSNTFHVDSIGFYNPSLVVFVGLTEDSNRVELIQHTSQINFLLLALPKLQPDQPKRKIGFLQVSD